jgi:hypothetical protein
VIGVAVGYLQTGLAAGDGVQFDFNGQIRERFESIAHPGFGLAPTGSDGYLLNRMLLGAQARVGDHFAVAGQLVSGSVIASDGPMPGTQDNPLDVVQLFAEGTFVEADGTLRLRAGRQPLALGAARLVSTRESTNVRRSFDGLRATWVGSRSHLDAFYLELVLPGTEVFDDARRAGQSFWGLYLTRDDAQAVPAGFDLYYLGFRNERATFAFETAEEVRHTTGARYFGASRGRDWNLEAAWQWGSFGRSRIRAWTVSSDVGYTFSAIALAPRLGFKADVISGDRNRHDGTLGTFNPLFPKLPYFSDANVITPANLFDVQPTLGLTLTDELHVSGSWNVLWQYSREDAFYLPPLRPIATFSKSGDRYIGQQWSFTVDWKATSLMTVGVGFVEFQPGSGIRQVGGERGRFFYASGQVDF